MKVIILKKWMGIHIMVARREAKNYKAAWQKKFSKSDLITKKTFTFGE